MFAAFSSRVFQPIKSFTRNFAQMVSDPSFYMSMEAKYGSINYKPMPIVISEAQDCHVWDVTGRRYLDFLACYATVNQGHRHPRIIQSLVDQAHKVTLTSRVFFNDNLGIYQKLMCETFGFQKHLPMNTGVEGAESAVKLARRWAYVNKGVPRNDALMVFPKDCYWGRSLAALSASTDPSCYGGYGPYMNGFLNVEYNNIPALESLFQNHPNIAGYLFEPIQGEAGVMIPSGNYLRRVRDLCTKYNVLMIADEVQTGMGRAGYLSACQKENVKPDILVLGKALSGGTMPISCVLADDDIMLNIKTGQHGSTYGGNPLSNAVGITALEVIQDENLCKKSLDRGNYLLKKLDELKIKYPNIITGVRGQGLMCAMDINPKYADATDLCLKMVLEGLLVKPTHDTIIRISPPLTVSTDLIDEAVSIMDKIITQTCNDSSLNNHRKYGL